MIASFSFLNTIQSTVKELGLPVADLLILNLNGYCKSAVDYLLEKGHIAEVDIERSMARASKLSPEAIAYPGKLYTAPYMAVYWLNVAHAAESKVSQDFLNKDHRKYGGKDAEIFKAAIEVLCQVAEYMVMPAGNVPELPAEGELAAAKLLLMWSIGGTCETLAGLGLAGFDTLKAMQKKGGLVTGGETSRVADQQWRNAALSHCQELQSLHPDWGIQKLAKEIQKKIPTAPADPGNIKSTVSKWFRRESFHLAYLPPQNQRLRKRWNKSGFRATSPYIFIKHKMHFRLARPIKFNETH